MTIHFPGIPAYGTPAWSLFSQNFWPALYSGFIYSILTGLIVGFILIISQRIIERRMYYIQTLFDFERLWRRILVLLRRNPRFDFKSANFTIQPAAEELEPILNDIPLILWVQRLPQHRSKIKLLEELHARITEFRTNAQSLDDGLRNFMRNLGLATSAPVSLDNKLISYCVGRMHNRDAKMLLSWLELHVSQEAGFESRYQSLAHHPTLPQAVAKYLQSYKDIQETLDKLKAVTT